MYNVNGYGTPQYGWQYPMNQVNNNAPQAANTDLIWVQGEAGAKSYLVAPGHAVVLFDSENPVFYIKSVDQSGMPQPLKTYDFSEHKEEQAVTPDMSQYVTKAEMKDYLLQLINDAKKGAE